MTRFHIRCPSASSVSSVGSINLNNVSTAERAKPAATATRSLSVVQDAEPNHPLPSSPMRPTASVRRVDKGKLRAGGSFKTHADKKEEIRMAKKKAEIKEYKRDMSFVFVGNLSSSVNEAQLEELFKGCGPIRRIVIRASSGVCVPTANLRRPYWGFGQPLAGIHYATVEFWSPAAARKALEFKGREFLGNPLVVSFSSVDLPETVQVIKGLLMEKEEPEIDWRFLWNMQVGEIKRLTIEKTEIIPDPRTSKQKGSPAKVIKGLARRVGLYAPSGSTTTDAAPQNRHPDPFTFPETLT